MGIVFIWCCSEGWWKFPWISMVLEAICAVGDYLYMTHPLKCPYLDIWRSRPISWLEERARTKQLTCLKVKTIYHIWKSMCFWRLRLVIWPSLLNPFYSFILIWNLEESHQICAGWLGHIYFYKIYSKGEWKNVWNPAEKHCLLQAQVRKFTFC